MIEQEIYFGLGFVVAGLLALGFAPLLWARALRLTRQRLQIQIPVSMQEILADRDHLRAEFAVERRKLEQAMDRVRAGKAQDMAELGRRAATAFALSEDLAAVRTIERAQHAEILILQREAHENDAQRGMLRIALHHAEAALEREQAGHRALLRAHRALEGLAEERRTTIAALNTRAMGLEMTIEDADRARAALERQADAAKRTEQEIIEARDRMADELATLQAAHETLRKRLSSESVQAAAAAQATLAVASDLEAAQARIAVLEAEGVTLRASIEDAKERDKIAHLQRSLRAEKARGDGRAALETMEGFQAENAALRGALEAARRHVGLDRTVQSGDAPPGTADGDAMLRASIHELGLAVARMAVSRQERAPETALPGEVMRSIERPEAGV